MTDQPKKKYAGRKPGVTPKKFNAERQETFLREYERTHLFYHSCATADISGTMVYEEMKVNPKFVEKKLQAEAKHREMIDELVRTRATSYEEQLVANGLLTGQTKTVYNARLLELYAKRHIREYADHQVVDQKTTHAGVVGVASLDVKAMSRKQRGLLKQLLEGEDEGTD